MESPTLNALRGRVRFALANPNALLLVAGLLATLAFTLQVILLPAREAAIEASERQRAQLERSIRRDQIERQSVATLARPQLLDRLPDAGRMPVELGRLLEMAEQGGLKFDAGEYRWVNGKEKAVDRYIVTLPVQGDYLAIRRFLVLLRTEFPTLAIEDVSLRRQNIGTTELEAQLRLVIFTRRVQS